MTANFKLNLLIAFLFISQIYTTTLDIAIGTKNRTNEFQVVIENLNKCINASSISLYIMDGNNNNEIKKFLSQHTWHFKQINVWQDDEVEIVKKNPGRWSIIYDFLIRQGSGEFVTYWSDDILVESNDIFQKAMNRLNKHPDAAIAVFHFKYHWHPKYRVILNDVGLICLNYGIMRREAYIKSSGLDHAYKFFRADNDLTNKIFFNLKYKTIINTDCLVRCLKSEWKNPHSHKQFYKNDAMHFNKKWKNKLLIRRVLNKKSIECIYPLSTKPNIEIK